MVDRTITRSNIKEMAQRETLEKIQEYAREARERQVDLVDFDASSTEARLAQTVKELQARVQEQQAALDKVRLLQVSQNLINLFSFVQER